MILKIDSRSDPRSPKTILARAATKEGGLVRLVLHPDVLADITRLKNGASDRLGQFGGLVHGNIWAASSNPEHRDEGTLGLTQPTAIYCGLKRPRNEHSNDDKTVIYITNPGRNYTWPFANEFADGPIRAPVPPNAVFAVYADYGDRHVDALRAGMAYPAPRDAVGVIVDWDWIRASSQDPRLPANPDTRYVKKIWDERDG
jgi:hypothetical protein